MKYIASYLLLILTLAQFGTSRFHELTGLGRSVGAMAKDAPTPATPAGYAFLIWILIFTLWSLCAIQQARPSQINNPLWQRLRNPMLLAVIGTNLWMLTAILHGNGFALLAIIILLTAAAFTALGRAKAAVGTLVPATRFNRYLLLPALGIMAGWLTLASFLNLAGAIQLRFDIPTGSTPGAIATLTAATLAGGYILAALRRQPTAAAAYALTLLWGLLAVVIANANDAFSAIGYGKLSIGVTALVCAIGVLIVLGCQRPRQQASAA